ncbi:MAG: xanthine dehydrogenase small subunit [Pseudomonadota bacterium]
MSDAIRFLLNGNAVEIRDLAPTTTLLNWLRYDQAMTGSKEGCAEGDCGACTVAMLDGETWRPVCACIQMLGMLHGRSVVTVEGISGPAGELHPVQAALAEGHGSQCGFCTPGFVMSLWTEYQTGRRPDTARTCDLLAGNLCRCTGYGPILGAAEDAFDRAAPGWSVPAEQLEPGSLDYEGSERRWWSPESVEELADLTARHPDATIVSGATDVGLWVTKHGFDPAEVIYTGRVRDLARITERDGWVEIGAAVTYAQAEACIAGLAPDFGALIRRIGGAQVRASGTIGGNIANGSPIGDTPPALIALGAELVLRHGTARRAIPLDAFFIEYGKQDRTPGEFVEAIRVPIPTAPDRLRCYKISKRFDQDITAVLGCFDIDNIGGEIRAARLAFGGMAGIPKRAQNAENALTGQPWSRTTVEAAMQAMTDDFKPLSDMRASSAYRMQVAQNLLMRYFLEMTEPETATRVTEIA